MTPTFNKDQVTAHFIHAFKEEAMQRFFRGCVVLDGWADIPEPSPDDDINAPGKGSIVFLDEVHGSMADSLRHHICFIVPVNAALNSVALRQNSQDMYSSKVLEQRTSSHNVACGCVTTG